MSVTFATTMVWIECCNCGIPFGLTEDHQKRLRQTHEWFYCPNGHHQHYPGKTAEEKRIAELEADNARLARARREMVEADEALSWDVKDARRRAMRYRHNRALKGAFWRGHEDRNCGREIGCCPYETNRGGFRAAWLDGFGAEDPDS